MNEASIIHKTLALVLAGGRGRRLSPLTESTPKPNVPSLGMYRIIDFTLSNCIHSGFDRVYVLTQYKRKSLHNYLENHYRDFAVSLPPAPLRSYRGAADAVYQNLSLFRSLRPERALVLSADQTYSMNYAPLLRRHRETGADVTIAAAEAPGDGGGLTTLRIDGEGQVTRIGSDCGPLRAGACDGRYAAMSVSVFNVKALVGALLQDAFDGDSRRDFAGILRSLLRTHRIHAYVLPRNHGGMQAYWKDVGTVDAYNESQMDLVDAGFPMRRSSGALWSVRPSVEGAARFLLHRGHALSEDRKYFHLSPGGVAVIPRNARFPNTRTPGASATVPFKAEPNPVHAGPVVRIHDSAQNLLGG